MKAFALGVEAGRHFKDNDSVFQLIEKGLNTKEAMLAETPRLELDALLPADEPFKSIAHGVAKGDVEGTIHLAKKAAGEDIDGLRIATEGLLRGMDAVSTLYNHKQAYVPEILMAAKALDAGLKECSGIEALETKGTVLIHTADGDLHDIGKNIVAAIISANGYRVIDLGTSVDSGQVLEAIRKNRPVAVLGSSLMTSTRGAFLETADLLKKEGIDVPFIIGGGACDRAFAGQRENTGYAKDPSALVEELDSIVRSQVK
ncbi:MAG TPA: cobalamin-dependent protein [Methanotrichaceae archaeon]|nr:cobalamin-dependent protein [Methanotrichaceae archaeon]